MRNSKSRPCRFRCPSRTDYRDYLALAYSNRAVFNWMSNDTAAAQSDLKKAAAVPEGRVFVAAMLRPCESQHRCSGVGGSEALRAEERETGPILTLEKGLVSPSLVDGLILRSVLMVYWSGRRGGS